MNIREIPIGYTVYIKAKLFGKSEEAKIGEMCISPINDDKADYWPEASIMERELWIMGYNGIPEELINL